MKTHCLIRASLISSLSSIAILAACTPATNVVADQATPHPSATSGLVETVPGSVRSDAAEPFEALAEQAFTADPAQLSLLLADARRAAEAIRGHVSAETFENLELRLQEAKSAIDGQRPSDIALAAVEGYRLVVEEIRPDLRVPTEVSLLDYAGFRIQADLKASPTRWADADQAAAYAHILWAGIGPSISDEALRARFQESMDAIDGALSAQDLDVAMHAVTVELDLVDELEVYYRG